MNTINPTTQTANILSLQEFCDLTRRACQLKYFPTNTIVHSTNGWAKLADMWEALIDEADMDIFRDATYFLKWGIRTNRPTPEYQTLVAAVSNALTQDGPAYDAWFNHEHCKSVIFETAYDFNPWCTNGTPYSLSYWHYRYTSHKMLLRILRYHKGYITKCKEFESDVRYYEGRILKLIPSAKDWPTEYWSNEDNIINELNMVCPYDYRNNLSAYHALLELTRSPKRMPTSSDWDIIQYVSNVRSFSMCWLETIWPQKSDAIIVQYLLLAEQRAAEALVKPRYCHSIGLYDPIPGVDYPLLSRSWIFSYVTKLLFDKKIPKDLVSQVKLALFNIAVKCSSNSTNVPLNSIP